MAEVFLGMQEGMGGFEKLVVIKRIFQHYCEDERFLQMFMDEARLAASIRHPNVVEILDIERDATGFFIVMEYLSGETLGYVIPTLQSRDELPPPHIVCRIGAAIAAGLHQAHTAHDATGAPQPVVHRDVTPSNVLVSYNGVVKLLDFGVAKAIAGEGETRVRGVKGKLSYLAPEQISNAPVDGRTDIFQLGIVLHEMLTGRGLFHAGNAHQRVLAVMEREIPRPSLVHPDVPPIVDEIVLAALERDPDKRLATAEVLRARLEEAIARMGQPASDRDVGAWMRESFSEAYSRRLALERSTASHMRQSRQIPHSLPPGAVPSWTAGTGEGSQPSYPGSGSGPTTGTGAGLVSGTGSGVVSNMGSGVSGQPMLIGTEPSTMTTMASEALQPRRGERRRRTWVAATLLLLVVAGGTGIALSLLDGGADAEKSAEVPVAESPPVAAAQAPGQASDQTPAPGQAPADTAEAAQPGPTATYVVEIHAEPASAAIELDGAPVARGSFARALPMDGNNHVLVISADGYKPRVITFRDAPPAKEVALERLAVSSDDGRRDRSSSSRSSRRARETADKAEQSRAPEQNTTAPATDNADSASRRRNEAKRPATDNLDPWAD
jgi:serine/threonine protein kinase